MTEVNRLASNAAITLTCPACGEETLVTGGQMSVCNCGQKLYPNEHEAGILKKRDAVMLRPIKAREARAFLTALANIGGMPRHLPLHPPSLILRIPGGGYKEVGGKDNFKDAEWLLKRFTNFFPPDVPKDDPQEREKYLLRLLHVRNYLRLAWGASEHSRRLWRIKTARCYARQLTVHRTVDSQTLLRVLELEEPPPDAIQQSFHYFEARASLARQCLNPGCRKDRFFFAEKPNQKYCSDPCSEVARSAAKKLWWDMHGSAWRKNRSKKSNKRSR